MKHTGLVSIDISDSSIKVLQLDTEGAVVAYGNRAIPAGVIVKGKIADVEAFGTHLNEVLADATPHALDPGDGRLRSVVCIPESKLFTHYMEIPNSIAQADLEAYVYEDAKRSIPFDLRNMYWDYHVLERNGKRSATFVSVQKLDLDNYVEALTKAGVRPAFVCSELFSLGRALSTDSNESYMIVDIGGHSTTIGVFGPEAIPHVSVKLPIAGEYFTVELMDRLSLSEAEARKEKREYGLDPKHKKTGVPDILADCLEEIVTEIAAARSFYEEKTGEHIKRIILAGGSALMPAIDIFFEKETGISTSVADPFAKMKKPEVFEKDAPRLFFATVIGLALLALSDARTHINLLTQYEYRNTNIRARLHRMRDVRSFDDLRFVFTRLIRRFSRYTEEVVATAETAEKRSISGQLIFTIIFLIAALGFLGFVILKYGT